MDVLGDDVLRELGELLLLRAASIAMFIAAVWFGLHVIAPRIRRTLDRTKPEDEGASERD